MAVARLTWLEKAPDVEAVVAHLESAAAAAKAPLQFTPAPVPAGADLSVLHQAALLRVRRQLAISHAESDRILAQEVRAIDDLVRTANLLVERLREWYALHAPEATRLVPDAEELTRLVAQQGERGVVMATLGKAQAATTSLGSDLDAADMAVLQGFATALQGVHESWRALEARVGQLMDEVAPNVASVVGPVIGARLIAISGGINRLATWPAGTVQLLGAETALFRHLKEGSRPPKHGILFQHPLVHSASPWNRGAVARALALAASTAAKADAFTKNDLKAHLAERVQADMAHIAKRKMPTGPRAGWTPGRKPYAPRGAPGAGRGPRSFERGPAGGGRGPARDGARRDERPWQPRGPPAGRADGGEAPPQRAWSRGPPDGAGRSEGPRYGRGPPPRSTGGSFRGGARDGPGGRSGPGSGAPPGGAGGSRFGGASRFGRGPGAGPGAGKPPPWKRKPQGAFRSDGKAAAPPGKGSGPKPRRDDA